MSVLVLDANQITPNLYATASALPVIDQYVEACLAINPDESYKFGTTTYSLSSCDPIFTTALTAVQNQVQVWSSVRLGLIASSYGAIQLMNAVGANSVLGQLLQIENSIVSQGGTATQDQRASISAAFAIFQQWLGLVISQMASNIAAFNAFSAGVTADHATLAAGAQAIGPFKEKLDSFLEGEVSWGYYWGKMVLGIKARWDRSLDNLSQSVEAVLAANEAAQDSISNLQTGWTALQKLETDISASMEAAQADEIGGLLQRLEISASAIAWNNLNQLATQLSSQLTTSKGNYALSQSR